MPLSAPLLAMDRSHQRRSAQKLQSADNKSFIIVIIQRFSFTRLHHLFYPLSVAERSALYAAFMLSGRTWKEGRVYRQNSALNSLTKRRRRKKKPGARYLQNAPASCPGRDAFMLVTPCVVFNNIVRLRSVIKSSGTGQMLDRSAVWKRVGWWTQRGVMWFVWGHVPTHVAQQKMRKKEVLQDKIQCLKSY